MFISVNSQIGNDCMESMNYIRLKHHLNDSTSEGIHFGITANHNIEWQIIGQRLKWYTNKADRNTTEQNCRWQPRYYDELPQAGTGLSIQRRFPEIWRNFGAGYGKLHAWWCYHFYHFNYTWVEYKFNLLPGDIF